MTPTRLRLRSQDLEAVHLEPGTDNYKDVCDWLASIDGVHDLAHDGEGTVTFRASGVCYEAAPDTWVVRAPGPDLFQVVGPEAIERFYDVVDSDLGELADRIWDEGMRIHTVINLGHQLGVDQVPSDIVDWFDDHDGGRLAELIGLKQEWIDEHGWRTTLEEEGGRVTGWLLDVDRPILVPTKDGRGASHQGYRGHTVVGATYDEALEKAVAWAEAEGQRMWPRQAVNEETDRG